MYPRIILLLCVLLILWLFREDRKGRRTTSRALLIPGIWIGILGSRPVSYWFGAGGGRDIEGNPINTFLFAFLIVSSVLVLFNRGFNWGQALGKNKALFFIYFYLALSAFWSEAPLVSLKRLVKDFGCVTTALLLLTEVNPAEAIRTVFVRVSYILFPLSFVLEKYFPEIGRGYSVAGVPMLVGVTTQKNSLGQMLFVFGLMVVWDLLEIRKTDPGKGRRRQENIRIGMLLLGALLMIRCDSQTSLVCFIVGVFVLWGSGRLVRFANGKSLLISCIIAAFGLIALDKTFHLSDMVIRALGRNPTLTGRTEIWRLVMNQETNPIFGNGFYIFWDSDKGTAIIRALTEIQSAHNGYLELYLDGGIVALALLGVLLLSAGKRAIDHWYQQTPMGMMALVFWLLAIIYNFSESNYFRLAPLWFAFLLMTIECPRRFRSASGLSQAAEKKPFPRNSQNYADYQRR
ncbi:MAG: O-antigen ligase family protein [Verrucomicrobia bacterium]|nr:O-antigen ligase family protein [Verrucomicrobiota bacterium]